MGVDFDVRQCGRAEYPGFLNVLNEAFNFSEDGCWFQTKLSNCTPYPHLATDEQIGRHIVAVNRENGDVMGGTGAYPFELIVSEDTPGGERFVLPALGIGQVCCAKKYRNLGVMSATLRAALDGAIEDGAGVGFLGGDRYRYGRFGFDYGGGALKLDFSYERLITYTDTDDGNLETGVANTTDIGLLARLYETLPSYLARDAAYWKMQLERDRYIWLLGHIGDDFAYVAYSNENTKNIVEICGAPSTAVALLVNHMKTHGTDRVTVSLPVSPGRGDPLYEKLRAASSYAHAAPNGMSLVAILSAEKVYGILKPAIDRMGISPRDGFETGETVAYLLGSLGHPYPRFLRQSAAPIRQFSFWLSEADGV